MSIRRSEQLIPEMPGTYPTSTHSESRTTYTLHRHRPIRHLHMPSPEQRWQETEEWFRPGDGDNTSRASTPSLYSDEEHQPSIAAASYYTTRSSQRPALIVGNSTPAGSGSESQILQVNNRRVRSNVLRRKPTTSRPASQISKAAKRCSKPLPTTPTSVKRQSMLLLAKRRESGAAGSHRDRVEMMGVCTLLRRALEWMRENSAKGWCRLSERRPRGWPGIPSANAGSVYAAGPNARRGYGSLASRRGLSRRGSNSRRLSRGSNVSITGFSDRPRSMSTMTDQSVVYVYHYRKRRDV
ncbi:hypothetical protein BD410DRAFT_846369 [Rickenella mellea]|uniref:Uncharacterized protein n=1 Tax=Rickenella mellea TaxID=50990 RepID=A0A4Y7PHQ1_9AGAM|nr:hypothetical protein BD410DRAFT_846369 [Rickenella mellea]